MISRQDSFSFDEHHDREPTPEEINAAWKDYRETGDLESRNFLATHYYNTIVRPIAHRVKGRIIDELRGEDWLSRQTRERKTKLVRANEQFFKQTGREPTDAELQEMLGLNDREYIPYRIIREADQSRFVRFCEIGLPNEESTDGLFSEADHSSMQLEDVHEQNSLETICAKDQFRSLLSGFDRYQQMSMILYYEEGLTMKEIGRAIDRSESLVSNIIRDVTKIVKERIETDVRYETSREIVA